MMKRLASRMVTTTGSHTRKCSSLTQTVTTAAHRSAAPSCRNRSRPTFNCSSPLSRKGAVQYYRSSSLEVPSPEKPHAKTVLQYSFTDGTSSWSEEGRREFLDHLQRARDDGLLAMGGNFEASNDGQLIFNTDDSKEVEALVSKTKLLKVEGLSTWMVVIKGAESEEQPSPEKPHVKTVVVYSFVDGMAEKRAPHRKDHLMLLTSACQTGLFAMGGAYNPPKHGQLLFNTDDKSKVEAFVQSDPYYRAGLVTSHLLRTWNVVV